MRFDVKVLAITSGVLWALSLFIFTWWVIAFDGSSSDPTIISKVYRGYSITPLGSLIGLAWGFVDGLICGAIFGWAYNFFANCCGKKAV